MARVRELIHHFPPFHKSSPSATIRPPYPTCGIETSPEIVGGCGFHLDIGACERWGFCVFASNKSPQLRSISMHLCVHEVKIRPRSYSSCRSCKGEKAVDNVLLGGQVPLELQPSFSPSPTNQKGSISTNRKLLMLTQSLERFDFSSPAMCWPVGCRLNRGAQMSSWPRDYFPADRVQDRTQFSFLRLSTMWNISRSVPLAGTRKKRLIV